MFALDTNAVSALFAGDEALEVLLSSDERLALPVIVVGEYRFGLIRSRYRRQLETLLDRLVAESELLLVDDQTTRHYAEVREALKRKGRPLPENDVWIAALAVQHRMPIVTRDEHFDHVEGLQRLDW